MYFFFFFLRFLYSLELLSVFIRFIKLKLDLRELDVVYKNCAQRCSFTCYRYYVTLLGTYCSAIEISYKKKKISWSTRDCFSN